MEESAQTIYLVLPRASALGEGGELSDRKLGAVAAGASGDSRHRRLPGRHLPLSRLLLVEGCTPPASYTWP